jgi:hypothetical protein
MRWIGFSIVWVTTAVLVMTAAVLAQTSQPDATAASTAPSSALPIDAATQPTAASAVPIDASTQPTAASAVPIDASTQPAVASAAPAEAATQPAVASAVPVDASTQPTAASAVPIDAATQPAVASAVPVASAVTASATTQPTVAPSPEQVLNQMLRGPDADHTAALAPQPAPVAAGSDSLTAPAADGSASAASPGGPPISAPLAVSPAGDTGPILREGSEIIDRVGRLQKSPDGNWSVFVFDSDGRALGDPPMFIVPNLKLVLMEAETERSSRDVRFRVTGSVTEYHGHNYILLEKAIVVNDKTQDF